MMSICPVFKLSGCSVFKRSKTGPFCVQPLFNHLNTKLVQYLNPHCNLKKNQLKTFERWLSFLQNYEVKVTKRGERVNRNYFSKCVAQFTNTFKYLLGSMYIIGKDLYV